MGNKTILELKSNGRERDSDKEKNDYLAPSEDKWTSSISNSFKKGCKIMKHSIIRPWSYPYNTLEIECTVSNMFFQSEENICRSSQKITIENLDGKLSTMETKISKLELQNQETLTNLELQSKKIARQLEEKEKSRAIPVPECPVCFEPLNKSPKIAQCVLGHLLCWNCKQRLELKDCPTCKGPVCGRAFGMENYLKTLFPTPGEFQFLADKAGPGAVVNVDESRIGG